MTSQLEFEFPAVITPRGDGTYLVKPGRPVARAVEIDVQAAARILGKTRHTIYRYIDEGLLTGLQTMPRARVKLIRAEVESLAKRTRTD